MSDGGELKKSVMLFGRDISKIPCFRNSWLYGILSGFGCGLTYFLFTSRVRMATHVGFGSFLAVTGTYWVQCRYNYSKTKFEMMRMQALMREHATYEGTDTEKEVDKQYKEYTEKLKTQ